MNKQYNVSGNENVQRSKIYEGDEVTFWDFVSTKKI
jgi:hypothetical protein